MKQNKYKKAKNIPAQTLIGHEGGHGPAKNHPSIHLNLNHLHYNLHTGAEDQTEAHSRMEMMIETMVNAKREVNLAAYH